ncbi:hypothetical protein [Bradyrhizobium sp. SEMIA]|uniref:hypothetical protein n=1 Tax=Bradyrhizobium sp. SEMIA TaxID=2597515 RepID=UPI0018A4570A|nr:hypothetical protein [Bradyrhizobium sp. SEMIA]QOG20827.1 hypothetical protein FOM02_29260 [Bradyrhizobium sp. SEMIA]
MARRREVVIGGSRWLFKPSPVTDRQPGVEHVREQVERFWAYALDSALAPGLVANDVYGISWAFKPINILARIGL